MKINIDGVLRLLCVYMLGIATALYLMDDGCLDVATAAAATAVARNNNTSTKNNNDNCPPSLNPSRAVHQGNHPGTQNHFDFVEIGTSNFETLIGNATSTSKGLSVEGLNMYLSQLPEKPHVTKVNAAISHVTNANEKTIPFYYIHPDDVRKYRLPAWLIGCNAAGKPQSEADRILKNRNLTHLMKVDNVPLMSFQNVIDKYSVDTIGYLKLDVEGHEPIIFESVFEICKQRPALWPRVIHYEHKHVKGYDQVKIGRELQDNGYVLAAFTNGDHRDYVYARIEGASLIH